MASMIFPGNGATVNNETIFVEGFRFDICEVAPSHYEYLNPGTTTRGASKPASRFFLSVEENFIVNYQIAVKWHSQTGQCRYDWFCAAKSDCKRWIADFEKELAIIERAAPKTEEGIAKLQAKKNWVKERFGIRLSARLAA